MSARPQEASVIDSGLGRVSRRNLLKGGAAAGVGGAMAFMPSGRRAATAQDIEWDAEADLVVIGAGASGLPAAIAAVDAGASVIVVEAHFDVGGRAIISGGVVHLGGGHSRQQEAGIEDSADQVFEDWISPDHPESRFSDREIVRAWADENAATFEFLVENGVRFDETWAENFPGIWGASSVQRGNPAVEWAVPSEVVIPGAPGSGLMRPLERSARQKGVNFLLQHKMTSIVRESPTSGRVVGITAVEVDRWFEPTLNTVNIRARKGVIVCTGGSSGDVLFRRILDPRLTEEYQPSGGALTHRAADGERAAMAIGATLWGTASQTMYEGQVTLEPTLLGAQYGYSSGFLPDSPVFFRARATGLSVNDWQDTILVKENGRRFYDEAAEPSFARSEAWVNAVLAWTGDPEKLNGGGPIWAIFDAEAVEREEWDVTPPSVDPSGYFFSGDTLEELAANIVNPYQWRPMPGDALRETVERYNSFVDSGTDEDFGKPAPQHKIETPPFYAAWNTPVLHDMLTGIRINGSSQVIDMDGEVIPGLYAAGESAGGFALHGLGRATVMGRIAGMHAASQSGA